MKYTYSGRELTASAEGAPPSDRSLTEARDLAGFGRRSVFKGAGLRVFIVLAVSSVVLYRLMGAQFRQVVLGAMVVLFQAAAVEFVGAVFRRRSGEKAANATTRAVKERKWNLLIWAVELALCALVLILAAIYWRMVFK